MQAQSERMATLDRTGTYLKQFGRKQDTIYVKNLLVGIRLRWKKILRRTDERGRLLQQAYKEDKRVGRHRLTWRLSKPGTGLGADLALKLVHG